MAQRKASVGGSSASEEGSPEGLPGVGVRAGAEWGTPTCWGSLVGYGGLGRVRRMTVLYIHTYIHIRINVEIEMKAWVCMYMLHTYIF